MMYIALATAAVDQSSDPVTDSDIDALLERYPQQDIFLPPDRDGTHTMGASPDDPAGSAPR